MTDYNYRVIALDPGGTTGWATYSAMLLPSPNGIERVEEDFTCGQMGPDDHHRQLFAHLETQTVNEYKVVCESFEFRQNRQRDNINLMSREYIGVVKLYEQEWGTPVVFQTAGLAKPFVTDQKIKKMGLWYPGHKHAMDAMRHLIYFLVNREKRTDLIECWRDL